METGLRVQVLVPLMDAYLRPHPNSAAVVRRLFQRNQAVPVRAMEAVCQREPAMVHYVCTAVQVRALTAAHWVADFTRLAVVPEQCDEVYQLFVGWFLGTLPAHQEVRTCVNLGHVHDT